MLLLLLSEYTKKPNRAGAFLGENLLKPGVSLLLLLQLVPHGLQLILILELNLR